jgi:caffeoyl-CoA O-methyltransferase
MLSDRGVIAVDNVLWSGRVVEGVEEADANTDVLRRFNDHVLADDRVVCVMLPLRDGVTLIRRRTSD